MAKRKKKKATRTTSLQPINNAPIPLSLPPPGAASEERFKSGASPPQGGGEHDPGAGVGQKIREAAGKAAKSGAMGVGNTALNAVNGTKRYIIQKAAQKVHAAVSEAERDNAAIETAHEAERIGEQLARSGVRKGAQMLRDRAKERNVSRKPPADFGAARRAANTAREVNLSQPALPPAAPLMIPGTVKPQQSTALMLPSEHIFGYVFADSRAAA